MVTVETEPGKKNQQYEFDKVFDQTSAGTMYFAALLPLLETVYYHHKDGTIIVYGPRNSGMTFFMGTKIVGKSRTLGTNEQFADYRNLLSESLNYFYAKCDKTRTDSQPLYPSAVITVGKRRVRVVLRSVPERDLRSAGVGGERCGHSKRVREEPGCGHKTAPEGVQAENCTFGAVFTMP